MVCLTALGYATCYDMVCVIVTQHVVKDALFCIKQLLSILADESLDKYVYPVCLP